MPTKFDIILLCNILDTIHLLQGNFNTLCWKKIEELLGFLSVHERHDSRTEPRFTE